MSDMKQTHHQQQRSVTGKPISSAALQPVDDGESWPALPDESLAQILECLQLKYRFQVQAVNRQWQRCSLTIVNELTVELEGKPDKKIMRLKQGLHYQTQEVPIEEASKLLGRFEQAVVKNLSVTLGEDSFTKEILHIVAKMAERATTFHLKYLYSKTIEHFGVICDVVGAYVTCMECLNTGHFSIPCTEEFITGFLKLNRMKVFKCNNVYPLFPVLIQHSEDIYTLLEEVHATIDSRDHNTTKRNLWSQFASTYRNKIKRIMVSIYHFNYIFIEEFGKFNHLEELTIEYTCRDLIQELVKFSCCLRSLAKSFHQLKVFNLSLKLNMRALISQANIQSGIENVMDAIGNFEKLSIFSLDFDILHVQYRDLFGDYKRLRSPQPNRVDLPLLHLLHNGANIKTFKGSSVISFEKEHLSWNTWASLREALPNVEDLNVGCRPGDLKHFSHLYSLKHICIWEPWKGQEPFPEEEIAELVDTCPSLVRVELGLTLDPTDLLFDSFAKAARRRMPMHQIFTAILLESDVTKKWTAKYSQVLPPNMILKVTCFP